MSIEGVGKVNNYRTLQSLVYEHIRDAILTGRLAPGQRVVAAKIAEEMGVSRMPVRESLRRLETEGLITTVPHKEAVVRRLSAKEMEDIYSVRLVLEGYGGRLAARRITPEEIAKLEETKRQLQGGVDRERVARDEAQRRLDVLAILGGTAPAQTCDTAGVFR